MTESLMIDVDAKCTFVTPTGRVTKWKRTTAKDALIRQLPVRCYLCKGKIKIHNSHTPESPQIHAEHVLRKDSEICQGGFHFQGTQKTSATPVV